MKKTHLRTHEVMKKKILGVFAKVLEIFGSKNSFNICPLPKIALAQILKIRWILEASKGKQSLCCLRLALLSLPGPVYILWDSWSG